MGKLGQSEMEKAAVTKSGMQLQQRGVPLPGVTAAPAWGHSSPSVTAAPAWGHTGHREECGCPAVAPLLGLGVPYTRQ